MKLDRITVNPAVCQGQPTIRGLRITVAFLLKQFAAGMTPAEILRAYPELEPDDLTQAAEYAAWLAGEQSRTWRSRAWAARPWQVRSAARPACRNQLDYKPAERGKYIEAFFSNIDWSAVEERLRRPASPGG
jgi:uncharacterized protein (DUF433 family)